jgi:outer membrane protein insertion porin family
MRYQTAIVCAVGAVAILPATHAQNSALNPAQTAPLIKSVQVQFAGASTVSEDRILANMRTRVGQPYSDAVVEEDIRSLYGSGVVSNVRIFGEPQADGVRVIVLVQGKSLLTEIEVKGTKELSEKRVRKEITSKLGAPVSEGTLESDRQKILTTYQDKGFGSAKVAFKVVSNEKTGASKVTFTVDEGGKALVSTIRFEGNASQKASKLQDVIKTKKAGLASFLTKSGRLNNDQLEDDTRALREFYQNQGFIDARISVDQQQSKSGDVVITFQINEGKRYEVGNISIQGAKVFSEAEIQAVTKVRSGSVYSPAAIRADIKQIQDLYGAKGYADFQSGARTKPAGGSKVDLEFNFDEGRISKVNRVNISGNTKTKDKVVRRELALAPGDIFNTKKMDASRERLTNLNYFSKVDVYPSDTGRDGARDLNVLLEEKRTGQLNFGAGFSSNDNLLGFAEVSQSNFDISNWNNFTGGGQKFRTRVQYGVLRKDVLVSLTEPFLFDRKLSFSQEIFYRSASFVSDAYSEQRYGFDSSLQWPTSEFSRARAGYRLENIGIDITDTSIKVPDLQNLKAAGDLVKSQVYGSWIYDSRDSLFLSRKGHRVEIGGSLSGGPLGGDISVYTFNTQATKYFHLPWDTILTLDSELAVADAYSGGEKYGGVPLYDRLFLGGVNNLRGFRFRHATPFFAGTNEPSGGRSLSRATAELTVPVMEKVRAAVFYDIGAINKNSFDFGGTVASDAGIGLRVELPIGPVRIDYAVPQQKPNALGSSSGRFNFNMGYQF